jgi:hypothetical protein
VALDTQFIAGATTFRFGFSFVEGASYEVTVRTQPINPAQICTVENAKGTVGSGDARDVKVRCITAYGIGGKVQGLAGTGLRLHLSWEGGAGEDVPVSSATPVADVPFAFQAKVLSGSSYSVTVAASPTSPVQDRPALRRSENLRSHYPRMRASLHGWSAREQVADCLQEC